MGRYVFKLPDVGEGTTEAEISKWHVTAGQHIEEDAPLVDVTTEKAVVEIPAPVSGTVVSIHGAVGEKIAVGSELVIIETGSSPEATTVPHGSAPVASANLPETAVEIKAENDLKVESEMKAANQVNASTGKTLASPSVRQQARQLGIDLHAVRGSGPGGRVLQTDLDNYFRAAGRSSAVQSTRHPDVPDQDIVTEHRVIGIRRKIAERMQEAKRRIPQFSYVEEVDVTALEGLRLRLNNEKYAGTRPKLTPLPFVMRALVRALTAHPDINARFDDENEIVHRHVAVHIGIATQTANGLLVPVARHAQTRKLWDCATEVNRLITAAREGKAALGELSGSTITITSLGALGGIASTPIINYPEVAIIGINKIIERPVAQDGQVVVRKIMNLSSSFDHRVVDGWTAAAFIQDVKRELEEPEILLRE